MAHYAKIKDNIVVEVIVAEESVINSFDNPNEWVKTSYNTHEGVHSEGGTPLRKNFAGIGYTYDSIRDAFIEPQPYPSWTLIEDTCKWDPPVEAPSGDTPHEWNEGKGKWEKAENLVEMQAEVDELIRLENE